ncbi:MAG: AAA family ATPase [Pirellulales bacterium]|nr:AAA family ATPase [Pirellulales bacterium]
MAIANSGVFSLPLAGPWAGPFRRRAVWPRSAAPSASAAPANVATGVAATGPDEPLDDFVAGPENHGLLIALRAVCGKPWWSGALVLHGPSGVGKTHLAFGVYAAFAQQHGLGATGDEARPVGRAGTPRAVLIRGADFARQYADAVETNTTAAWRKDLQSAALLVLDDLGQLAGKVEAQQQLCQILDYLSARRRAIVITSSASPANSRELSPRLRSRLGGGLVLPIALPGPAAKAELVRELAERRALRLSAAAVERLAAGPWTTCMELRGVLMTLDFASSGMIDVTAIDKLLAAQGASRQVKLPEIARLCARRFHLTLADLRGPSRRRTTCAARQLAMLLAREEGPFTMAAIGQYFGRRDHTTVMHACRQAAAAVEADPVLREAYGELRTALQATGTGP